MKSKIKIYKMNGRFKAFLKGCCEKNCHKKVHLWVKGIFQRVKKRFRRIFFIKKGEKIIFFSWNFTKILTEKRGGAEKIIKKRLIVVHGFRVVIMVLAIRIPSRVISIRSKIGWFWWTWKWKNRHIFLCQQTTIIYLYTKQIKLLY